MLPVKPLDTSRPREYRSSGKMRLGLRSLRWNVQCCPAVSPRLRRRSAKRIVRKRGKERGRARRVRCQNRRQACRRQRGKVRGSETPTPPFYGHKRGRSRIDLTSVLNLYRPAATGAYRVRGAVRVRKSARLANSRSSHPSR